MKNARKVVRIQLDPSTPSKAGFALVREITRRLNQKGWGGMVSTHEGYGIVTEEYNELGLAIQSNDLEQIMKEALDLQVACSALYQSIKQKTLSTRQT